MKRLIAYGAWAFLAVSSALPAQAGEMMEGTVLEVRESASQAVIEDDRTRAPLEVFVSGNTRFDGVSGLADLRGGERVRVEGSVDFVAGGFAADSIEVVQERSEAMRGDIAGAGPAF